MKPQNESCGIQGHSCSRRQTGVIASVDSGSTASGDKLQDVPLLLPTRSRHARHSPYELTACRLTVAGLLEGRLSVWSNRTFCQV